MKAKPKVTIEKQVRDLERRLDRQEPVSRAIAWVQVKQIDKAEQLRKLAAAVVKSAWQHRCSDHIRGCTAVSDSKLDELAKFLEGLVPFQRGKIPAGVLKLARGK